MLEKCETAVLETCEPGRTAKTASRNPLDLLREKREWALYMWVVVKIMVPLWVLNALNIIRHLIFRVPKKGP